MVLYIYEQLYSVALAKQRARPACWDMLVIVVIHELVLDPRLT